VPPRVRGPGTNNRATPDSQRRSFLNSSSASLAACASNGTHLTALRPESSSTVIRATKPPLRFHRPRIGCLRLSRTLLYL
jgi:hypothetical protein